MVSFFAVDGALASYFAIPIEEPLALVIGLSPSLRLPLDTSQS